MRPKAYIAAAAAGLIAPVAFALPALAQDDDDSSDRDNNSFDRDFDSFDRDDRDDRDFDRDDRDFDRGDADIDIAASSSEVTGDVTFLIEATDLNPFTEIELASPDLEAACESDNIDGFTTTADRDGFVDATASAEDCVPGTYRVSISEQDTPFRTFSETVTID